MRRVGFIGLGRMGLPMAQNLARAGYEVLAWNRTPKEAEGLVLVGSPKEAAGTGLVITMLADDAATEAVLTRGLSREEIDQFLSIAEKLKRNLLRDTAARGPEAPVPSGSE